MMKENTKPRGANAAQSKKITLEKCGSATVRFIDPDGKPIAGKPQAVLIELADQRTPEVGIAPPGYKSGPTFANWEVDSEKYQNQNQRTDDAGRLQLTHLVPGVTCLVRTGNFVPGQLGINEYLVIRVASGQDVDAQDIVVQPRPAPRRAVEAQKPRAAEKAAHK